MSNGMTLKLEQDERHGILVYTLKIPAHDFAMAPLNGFDKLLIADCQGSQKVSDQLLALETIARKIELRESTMPEKAAPTVP